MSMVDCNYFGCDIQLTDGSSEEFIPFYENGISSSDFDFLKKVPITSSIDLWAYRSARLSIDWFDNKEELRIIPVLFLFGNDKISFTELLEKSNNILREIDCKDGVISDFISRLEDINPEEFDSNEDLIDCVMELISEIIDTELFEYIEDPPHTFRLFEVPANPIPASRILCLSMYYEYMEQRRYFDADYLGRYDAAEFEADCKTLPESPDCDECPHFKYLQAKWTDILWEKAPGFNSVNSASDPFDVNVSRALITGDSRQLLPEYWFNANNYELFVNNKTPDYPEVFVFPEGKTLIRAQFTGQFRNLRKVIIPNSAKIIDHDAFASCDLETVDIPDGVKIIGDKAFYGNRYLKSVHLPENLEKIGNYAFDECNSELILDIPESVREIGFTTRPDLLKFAIEHNLYISTDSFTYPRFDIYPIKKTDSLTIYRGFKMLMKESDAEMVRLLIKALKIPHDYRDNFMKFWHVGVMHDAIEFGTAEQAAILLNSGKLEFTDDELEYLIDYAAECGKTEHTVCLLNYKNEKDMQEEKEEA